MKRTRIVVAFIACLAWLVPSIPAFAAGGPSTKAKTKAPARPAKAAAKGPAKASGRPAKADSTSAPRIDYARRPDVTAYIEEMVAQQGFDRGALFAVFADARYSEAAARLMRPAATVSARRDWLAYRARFIEPVRLDGGLRFWDENAATLARAEQLYGVPAEIIVGIVGVETVYGRNTGSFRVLDALTTLAFDYPNKERDRSPFFRGQLTDALVLSRDRGIDVRDLRGSYAGAIGMPQFMPGSILRYAVDFDGDGRIDLAGSVPDVIGSVARFLAEHGWVRGLPTHVVLLGGPADERQRADAASMIEAGSVPSFAAARFADAGFVFADLPPDVPLALIDLPSGVDAEGRPLTRHLAGTQNFHVITRYNRSYFYAYSVIELGAAVKAMREGR